MQLSENARRSNEQKNKNGEITGMAPLGYENYVDERGKKFVRPKEPDATIIKKLFEMYSLGNTSVAELIKNKVSAHEKADNSFDETILGLLDIATQAGYIFEKSSNVDLKRLLLKFVFENITLTEGEISYKLKFPFNEFVNTTILRKKTTTSYEPMQTITNQGLYGNDNENLQIGYMKSIEPQILDKKQEVTLKMQPLSKLVMLTAQFTNNIINKITSHYLVLLILLNFIRAASTSNLEENVVFASSGLASILSKIPFSRASQ